jgi:leader peptidase (prepilin peptidase)/N-methyltransferase
MEPDMEIYLTILIVLLGAALGSFINVVVDRLPEGRSLMGPPSHCDACQRRLSGLDLVPIFSYIFLRGRCRHCRARIPRQVLLVELGCGLWTGFLFWHFGLSAELATAAFFSFIFIVIGLIDLKTKLVFGVIIFPAIGIAMLMAAFVLPNGIINSLEGAGLGAFIILIPFLVTRGRGMGFGDVEIAFLIGLAFGFADVVTPLLIGIVMGGVAAIFLLVFKIKGRKEAIPFGPFLAFGALISLVWAQQIMDWWLSLYGLK